MYCNNALKCYKVSLYIRFRLISVELHHPYQIRITNVKER